MPCVLIQSPNDALFVCGYFNLCDYRMPVATLASYLCVLLTWMIGVPLVCVVVLIPVFNTVKFHIAWITLKPRASSPAIPPGTSLD